MTYYNVFYLYNFMFVGFEKEPTSLKNGGNSYCINAAWREQHTYISVDIENTNKQINKNNRDSHEGHDH